MSIAATLYDISRSCLPATGGLLDIGLIHPDDVDTLEPLTFKPGKRMYLFQQDRFTGRLRSKQVTGQAPGDFREYNLTGTVRGIRLDMDLLIERLTNRRIHVLVTYWDETQRLLQNMRITTDHDSGDRLTSKNAYSIEGIARSLDGGSRLLNTTLDLPIIVVGGTSDPDPSSGIAGSVVTITTDNTDHTYTIPAGKLLTAVLVKSADAQTVSCGLTAGAIEIMDNVPLDAGQYALSGNNSLFAEIPTNIYFSGLVGTNTIKIWLLG